MVEKWIEDEAKKFADEQTIADGYYTGKNQFWYHQMHHSTLLELLEAFGARIASHAPAGGETPRVKFLRDVLRKAVVVLGGMTTEDVSDEFLANVPGDIQSHAEHVRELVEAAKMIEPILGHAVDSHTDKCDSFDCATHNQYTRFVNALKNFTEGQ